MEERSGSAILAIATVVVEDESQDEELELKKT